MLVVGTPGLQDRVQIPAASLLTLFVLVGPGAGTQLLPDGHSNRDWARPKPGARPSRLHGWLLPLPLLRPLRELIGNEAART